MPLSQTMEARAEAGRALDKLASTLGVRKATATKPEQYSVRKSFRDASAFLGRAGYTKLERAAIMKPFAISYDPNHRTR